MGTCRSALMLGLALLCGCGTVIDMTDRQRVYGGIRTDAWTLNDAVTDWEPDENPTMRKGISQLLFPFALLDLPLSLVLDTALLPVTGTIALVRE